MTLHSTYDPEVPPLLRRHAPELGTRGVAELIRRVIGRRPTREEWAEAGFRYRQGGYVRGEDRACDR